jgi:TRAP-type C4-dicarboxylate transport system permease small subunit
MMLLRIASLVFDRLGAILVGASAVLLALMAVLMNVEIFSRYLFKTSTQIADEYSGYLFTWMTLFCFLAALRSGRLLRVEAALNRMPRGLQRALEATGAAVGAAASLVLALATWDVAAASLEFGTRSLQTSDTPLFYPQVAMPICLGLLTLGFIETGLRQFVVPPRAASESEPP